MQIIKKSHVDGIKNHNKNGIFQGRVMEKVNEDDIESITEVDPLTGEKIP